MDLYSSFIAPMTTWLNQHPHWAGIFTFLISFSESLAVIGSIVPGSVTMTAIGMLIGAGVIPCVSTFIWAILGAIAGDSASYFLGFYYHEKIAEYWPFRKYPNMLISGKAFFAQHGGKSVFIGRFLGPLRSIIPVIAGMMRMPNNRFLIANISSAILWSFLYILPGIIIGSAASELSPHVATKLFLYILIALTVIWLSALVLKHLYCIISNYINNHLQAFWLWMSKHPKLEKWAEIISNPKKPHDHKQIALLIFALLCILSFIIVAISAHHRGLITHWDKEVFNFLQSLRQPAFDMIFMVFTFIGDKKVIIPLVFTLFFYFVYQKQKNEAIHWLSNGIIAGIIIYILKIFIGLPRPTGLVQIRHGSSFPSGHTTFSIAVFGFLFYLIAKNCSPAVRRLVVIPGSLLLLCITFSRIYLGMHWLSDIVGSTLLASSVLLLHILSYQRSGSSKINIVQLSIFAFSMVFAFCSYFIFYDFNRSLKGAQLKESYKTISMNNWWNSHTPLPSQRENRFGNPVSILNIQWLMPIDQIQDLLIRNNWQLLEKDSVSERFKRFLLSKNDPLPLFHQLYKNHIPQIIMIKQGYILRLWPSLVRIQQTNLPLWIGTLSQLKQEHRSIFNFHKTKKTSINYLPSKLLKSELQELKYRSKKDPHGFEILLVKPQQSNSSEND